MSTTTTHKSSSLQTIPCTISGLWALQPLTPLKTLKNYEHASTLCTQLAVRPLNAVQKEYFRELTGLVEAYEEDHELLQKTERELVKLVKQGSASHSI